mgnify:FL=1
MKNSLNNATEYFKLFGAGNLEGLSEMYSDDIHLIDWNGQWKGKEEVLKMNKVLFDSTTLSVTVHLVDGSGFLAPEERIYCFISIQVGDEVIKVMDVIDFNENGKIIKIEAFKG